MNAREIVKARYDHQGTEITPTDIIIEDELYDRLTEYYGDEDWHSKKVRMFKCEYLQVDTLHQFKMEDSDLEKDGFGSIWDLSKRPWHLVKPGMSEPNFNNYKFPDTETFVQKILDDKAEAIRQYEADDEHYRIISMQWGIYEHTWRMRGYENALMDMILEPDFYEELINKITDLYIAMVEACAGVPADMIFVGDDWCDQRGLIMGKELWNKFIRPCTDRFYKAIKKQGWKIMHHCCGSMYDIYDDLVDLGLDVSESVQPEAKNMEPSLLKSKWGDKLSFWGCLGSQGVLYHGSPEDIRNEILRLHELFKNDGGFVLAPAKPLFYNMPIEKAVAVIDTFAEINGMER